MKTLLLVASLRKESLNLRLAHRAAAHLSAAGATPEIRRLNEFEMPLYDGDIESASGLPPGAEKLAAAIRAADALVIASPEYNYSIPGVLKNAIDWISRERPRNCLKHLPVQLISASPAEAGGIRGLWHLRQPLTGNFCHIHAPMFALAQAHEGFNEDGTLRNAKLDEMLAGMMADFTHFAGALNATREKLS